MRLLAATGVLQARARGRTPSRCRARVPDVLALDLLRRFSEEGVEGVVGQADAAVGIEHDERLAHRLDNGQRRVARLQQLVALPDRSMSTATIVAPSMRSSAVRNGQHAQHPPAAVAVADLALPRLNRGNHLVDDRRDAVDGQRELDVLDRSSDVGRQQVERLLRRGCQAAERAGRARR